MNEWVSEVQDCLLPILWDTPQVGHIALHSMLNDSKSVIRSILLILQMQKLSLSDVG